MLKGVNTPPVGFHQRCKFVPIRAMSLIPSGDQGKVLYPACHVRVFALFVRTTIDPRDAGNALLFAQLNVVGFCVWVLRTRKTPWSPKFAIPEKIQLKISTNPSYTACLPGPNLTNPVLVCPELKSTEFSLWQVFPVAPSSFTFPLVQGQPT